MSAALGSYTAGYVGFGIAYADGPVPYVSFADAVWLGSYPLAWFALVLLVRGPARQSRTCCRSRPSSACSG
jgi:hypothetical protein